MAGFEPEPRAPVRRKPAGVEAQDAPKGAQDAPKGAQAGRREPGY
jgi:hypothetical protein